MPKTVEVVLNWGGGLEIPKKELKKKTRRRARGDTLKRAGGLMRPKKEISKKEKNREEERERMGGALKKKVTKERRRLLFESGKGSSVTA